MKKKSVSRANELKRVARKTALCLAALSLLFAVLSPRDDTSSPRDICCRSRGAMCVPNEREREGKSAKVQRDYLRSKTSSSSEFTSRLTGTERRHAHRSSTPRRPVRPRSSENRRFRRCPARGGDRSGPGERGERESHFVVFLVLIANEQREKSVFFLSVLQVSSPPLLRLFPPLCFTVLGSGARWGHRYPITRS